MVVYTMPAIVPLLLTVGTYYLFGLFLDDVNAFGVAAIIGSLVSALMEFGGLRGTIFFIPVGAWLGFFSLEAAFELIGIRVMPFTSEPGIGLAIMSVIAALLGAASLLGMFAGGGGEEAPAEGGQPMNQPRG